MMHGQHFAEQDRRKQNFPDGVSVDKDLEIKAIPYVQKLLGKCISKVQLSGKIPKAAAFLPAPV